MSRQSEHLALRKQLLQARSALCRLQIRHESVAVRNSLGWTEAGSTAAASPSIRLAAMGLALFGVSRSRASRWFKWATGVLLVARLSVVAVQLLRKP
jgi:hypothetical protein